MRAIDDRGRLFGRVNMVDAAIGAFVLVLIPLAYGTFLLFRSPAPSVASVTRVPISTEERRLAGGSRLSAKLKVRGSGFRPMLRASIDQAPALGFVFEEEKVDIELGEELVGNGVVPALGVPLAAVVPAAEMNREGHLRAIDALEARIVRANRLIERRVGVEPHLVVDVPPPLGIDVVAVAWRIDLNVADPSVREPCDLALDDRHDVPQKG